MTFIHYCLLVFIFYLIWVFIFYLELLCVIMFKVFVVRIFRDFYIFWVCAVLAGCEMPGSKSLESPGTTYLDYRIWGDENDGEVTVLLQFLDGGIYGKTISLAPPAEVLLDGKPLGADSSRMTGAFYETRSTIDSFLGQHEIKFRDIDGREYLESFQFEKVSLASELPERIGRGDIVIALDGLEEVDIVRVLMTDTAFNSRGVNRMDTLRNGKMLISRQDLANLVNGPVHLELIWELEKELKEAPGAGGKISISYGLSREFALVDSLLP